MSGHSDQQGPSSGLARTLEGKIVGKKYHLKRLLESGSLGFVYEAEQIGLTRSVAVKIMRASLADDAACVERFQTEALAASRVNHPHAAAVFDFGVTVEGVPFVVMERVRGRSLRDVLRERRFTPDEVVVLGGQILAALDEAHAAGVVHGGLDGASVFLHQAGTDLVAKVTDFGATRFLEAAPEPPTPACDVHAVGALLYEMLTGSAPSSPPVPPRDLVAACPKPLGDAILMALDPQPGTRFPDAGAFRRWLLASPDTEGQERICSSCGSPRAPSERFCARCGAALTKEQSARANPSARADSSTESDTRAPSLSRTTCRVVPRPGSPFVGRGEELARLDRFLRGGERSRVLAVVGPRGAGKASLVLEATRRVESAATFVAGPDPTGLAGPWYPVLAMLRSVLGLPPTPEYDDLGDAVARCGLPARDAPGLAEIFALPGPLVHAEIAVRRREAIVAARRALGSATRRHAECVLCFVDVGDYDEPSRRFLAGMVEAVADQGARILITADSEEQVLGVPAIRLGPLDLRATATLIADLAGPRAPEVLDVAVRLTGGWPAGVEQFAAWLDEGNDPASAPESLVDLQAERFALLPATPRLLLQAVAILGQVAPRAQAVAMMSGQPSIHAALALLVRAGHLVVEGRDLVISSWDVRSTVIACTPPDVRRRLARAALDQRTKRESPELVGTLAEAVRDDALATSAFLEAGAAALRRFDERASARWFEQARQAAGRRVFQGEADAVDNFIEASVSVADVLRGTGELPLARACIMEAALPDLNKRHRAALARARARIGLAAGDARIAARELRTAIGLAIRYGGTSFLCEAYRDLAQAWLELGDLRQAVAELNEAMDLLALGAEPGGVPDGGWMLPLQLAELEVRSQHLDSALEAARTALRWAEAKSDLRGRGRAHAMLALIADALGGFSEGQAHRVAALEALRAMGDRRSTAELLLASARSTADLVVRAGEDAGRRVVTDDGALATARELAVELEWTEGIEAARGDTVS